MEPIALALLGVSVLFGFGVFRIGTQSDWHWIAALLAALVPVAFTFFLGLIGLIVGGAFLVSVWKASNV